MPSLTCTWKRLSLEALPAELLHRSSHSLALIGRRAYLFGGERKPRVPVDSDVLMLDLDGGNHKVLKTVHGGPAPRVGAAMAVDRSNACFYLWGGRGGKDMSAIATRSSADEDADAVDDLWRFDTKKESWEKTVSRGAFPEGRSFHTMAMLENCLYVHAGCTAAGRLASLESLDCKSAAWSAQPPAPGPARGGTVLTAIPSPRDEDRLVLARWGGFCGNELGGPLDIFDPVQGEWTSHSAPVEGGEADPRKRSVHGFVPITPPLRLDNSRAVALLFMGEGEGAPAQLGHDGAGKFLSDYYILLQSEQGYCWRPLNDVARSALPGQTLPEARGWFAFDGQALDDGRCGVRVVLHGGLNEQNERLSDAWVLEIESAAA